jgi:hypothetical protein
MGLTSQELQQLATTTRNLINSQSLKEAGDVILANTALLLSDEAIPIMDQTGDGLGNVSTQMLTYNEGKSVSYFPDCACTRKGADVGSWGAKRSSARSEHCRF